MLGVGGALSGKLSKTEDHGLTTELWHTGNSQSITEVLTNVALTDVSPKNASGCRKTCEISKEKRKTKKVAGTK